MVTIYRNILKAKLSTAEVPKGYGAPLFDVLRYEDHDSCQKKSGSMVKVLFFSFYTFVITKILTHLPTQYQMNSSRHPIANLKLKIFGKVNFQQGRI